MKTLRASMVIQWDSTGHVEIEINTEPVPKSLVLEIMNNATKALAQDILSEGQEEGLTGKELEKYMDARIKVDREKLNELLRE